MSETTTQVTEQTPEQEAQAAADKVRLESLQKVHGQWVGDLPDVITGSRALHLAVTVGFGSLQRMGHKRGSTVTPLSVAKVAEAREFLPAQVDDLKFLAEQRGSQAAKNTAAWCAAFLRRAAKRAADAEKAAAKEAEEAAKAE